MHPVKVRLMGGLVPRREYMVLTKSTASDNGVLLAIFPLAHRRVLCMLSLVLVYPTKFSIGRFFNLNSRKVGTPNMAPAVVLVPMRASLLKIDTVSLQKPTSNNSTELFAQKERSSSVSSSVFGQFGACEQ